MTSLAARLGTTAIIKKESSIRKSEKSTILDRVVKYEQILKKAHWI